MNGFVHMSVLSETREKKVLTIKGLVAEAADPALRDKMSLFGQFIDD